MRPLALLAVALVTLSACGEPGPPMTPPEGWVADDDRWYVPGTDTAAALRASAPRFPTPSMAAPPHA